MSNLRPPEETTSTAPVSLNTYTTEHSIRLDSPCRRRRRRTVRSSRRTRPAPRQNPEKEAREPKHGCENAECLSRIPLTAVIVRQVDTSPAPDVAALYLIIVVVLQQTEHSEPCSGKDEIGAKVDICCVREDHPEQSKPNRNGRYDSAVY